MRILLFLSILLSAAYAAPIDDEEVRHRLSSQGVPEPAIEQYLDASFHLPDHSEEKADRYRKWQERWASHLTGVEELQPHPEPIVPERTTIAAPSEPEHLGDVERALVQQLQRVGAPEAAYSELLSLRLDEPPMSDEKMERYSRWIQKWAPMLAELEDRKDRVIPMDHETTPITPTPAPLYIPPEFESMTEQLRAVDIQEIEQLRSEGEPDYAIAAYLAGREVARSIERESRETTTTEQPTTDASMKEQIAKSFRSEGLPEEAIVDYLDLIEDETPFDEQKGIRMTQWGVKWHPVMERHMRERGERQEKLQTLVLNTHNQVTLLFSASQQLTNKLMEGGPMEEEMSMEKLLSDDLFTALPSVVRQAYTFILQESKRTSGKEWQMSRG